MILSFWIQYLLVGSSGLKALEMVFLVWRGFLLMFLADGPSWGVQHLSRRCQEVWSNSAPSGIDAHVNHAEVWGPKLCYNYLQLCARTF